MSADTSQENRRVSQYLTFQSAGTAYALEILRVKEIIPFTGATRVPLAPDVIRGLINLRGSAVAVVDLAVRFGAPPTPESKRTCVVIVDSVDRDDGSVFGILADSVSEVLEVMDDDIDSAPELGMGDAAELLDGLARVGDAFVPILNVESVLAPGEALSAILPDASLPPPADTAPPDAESPEGAAE